MTTIRSRMAADGDAVRCLTCWHLFTAHASTPKQGWWCVSCGPADGRHVLTGSFPRVQPPGPSASAPAPNASGIAVSGLGADAAAASGRTPVAAASSPRTGRVALASPEPVRS